MKIQKLSTFLAAVLILTQSQSPADDLLRATNLELLGGGVTRLTFEDFGTAATSGDDYIIETSRDLTGWLELGEVFVSDLGNGVFRATILEVGEDYRFFRVRFGDSDTGPTTLAWFDMAELSADEGSGSYFVTVHFSESYTGPLRYNWSGGASVGGLSGVANAAGTSVQIPLVIGDDTDVGELQELTLTLVTAEDTNYIVANSAGRSGATTLVIAENDAIWSGQFVGESEAVRFDLQLVQNGNAHSATIVAGGSGVVPKGTTGEYPASAVTRTGTSFEMSVGDIAVGATESNLLGSDATLAFEFSASGDGVGEQLIEGTATCTITRPDAPHLDRMITGTFVIARSPSDASNNEVELN